MRIALRLGLALALLSAALPAGAATIFYLDETNLASLTGGPWASVVLTDTTSADGRDGVHFVVDPLESAFSSTGGNFGIQSFYFNENTSYGALLTIENFDPTDWSYKYSGTLKYNAGGSFGKFEFTEYGTGSTRANPLSFDVFAPTGYSLTIGNLSTALSSEGYLFAGHIADFNGGESAKFATDTPGTPTNSVPEPDTLLLLGSGLLGLGLMRRRNRSF